MNESAYRPVEASQINAKTQWEQVSYCKQLLKDAGLNRPVNDVLFGFFRELKAEANAKGIYLDVIKDCAIVAHKKGQVDYHCVKQSTLDAVADVVIGEIAAKYQPSDEAPF